MKTNKVPQPPRQRSRAEQSPSFHRSGAVALMLRMPVSTLRVWERRYGLTQAALSPSGQRRYSADDVRRLALLKQLTGLGHAIGSLAPLAMAQLQGVASEHAQALATTQTGEQADAIPGLPVRPWRLALVGAALGTRLQRPAILRRLGRPVVLSGPFDDLAQAAAALQASDVDALLLHEPHLQAGWLKAADLAAPSLARVPKAVLYGFAADAVCEVLATAGTALLREPQPDVVLAQWLHTLCVTTAAPRPAARSTAPATRPVPQRRWEDAALADFAGLSSTIACECPRHVAELLMQLSHFEAYSAECEQRSAADAEIHADLKQVAAASRARFEVALERVALHEGLLLPSSERRDDAAAAARARRPKPPASAGPRRRS